MAATYTTMLARLRAALMDPAAAVWDDESLAEALRAALGTYAAAGASPAALQGLDGAPETTFPDLHESLLAWGAAGFAAVSRAADRAESFQLGSESAELNRWGEARLEAFQRALGWIFPARAAAAQAALLEAQAQAAAGQEARAQAAADQAAAERAAERERLADLRRADGPPWGCWQD